MSGEWRCRACGGGDGPHFDRSICACGSMHYYCGGCGAQDDDCEPAPHGAGGNAEQAQWGVVDGPDGEPVITARRDYTSDTGSKDDAEKARTDLLPVDALMEVAHVMTFGARKYAPHNWKGLSVSRLYGAALRHLWAWWRGEDLDPETGRPHLAHAACCVLMVLDQALNRPQYDDRPD